MKQNLNWKPGQILKGRYQVSGLLDGGGMSEVYLARDLEDGSEVVLKTDSGREADLLLSLDHEGIVWAFEAFSFHGQRILAEEFVRGGNLQSSVRKDGVFSVSEAFEIGLQLCSVLRYLHEQTPPVIYRDLKPQNVLLSESGRVKLIDFGIAGEAVRFGGLSAASYGTPGYAAPEQFASGRATCDARTDLFALGRVLCFLISGVEGKPQGRDPSRLIPDPYAAEIIARCTAEDPKERYQSAADLAADLQRWLEGEEEVLAADLPENPQKPKRSVNWASVILTFLAALIYAGGFLFGLGSFRTEHSWLKAGLIWGAALAAGSLYLGLGQIIRLLQTIKDQST